MQIEQMIEHSYRNFHVKGFDYVCLKRSPRHTRKAYFFDGAVSQLPEVVNPHDHRYHFTTQVIAGVMSNSTYTEVGMGHPDGVPYHRFSWDTPLNGGSGFKFEKTTNLVEMRRYRYTPGEVYLMRAEELHTIRMHAEGTVILLDQFEDVVPVGTPTSTFMHDRAPPEMSGLYERFSPDQLIRRLNQLREMGVALPKTPR